MLKLFGDVIHVILTAPVVVFGGMAKAEPGNVYVGFDTYYILGAQATGKDDAEAELRLQHLLEEALSLKESCRTEFGFVELKGSPLPEVPAIYDRKRRLQIGLGYFRVKYLEGIGTGPDMSAANGGMP